MSPLTRPATKPDPQDDVLEAEWQRTVVDLARQLGWKRIYHTYNSRRSAHGFPDLVLVRDRVLFLELKRNQTRLTEDQKGWLRDLRSAGGEGYVARPRDLEALAKVLTWRAPNVLPPTSSLGLATDEEAGRA